MARNLMIFGLALIAAAILLTLVSLVIQVALPLGALLFIIGLIWHLLQPSDKKTQD